jgi:uncharacterized protein (TIGR02271 family)
MAANDKDIVIPIIREEVHADAVPVVTGGVRVTKRVESHDEVVEQELLKSSVEVDRVPVDRVVDGPQPVRRVDNTIIVPVVSEVLRGEKQSVVTEEIHITEHQQQETVQTKVTLNSEQPQIERLDSAGNVVSGNVVSNNVVSDNVVSNKPVPSNVVLNDERTAEDTMKLSGQPASILKRNRGASVDPQSKPSALPATPSILTNRPKKKTE